MVENVSNSESQLRSETSVEEASGSQVVSELSVYTVSYTSLISLSVRVCECVAELLVLRRNFLLCCLGCSAISYSEDDFTETAEAGLLSWSVIGAGGIFNVQVGQ